MSQIRAEQTSVTHLPGLDPRPDAPRVLRLRSARSEHPLEESESWPEPGSCTSSECQASAGWRRRRARPLWERWSLAEGRRTAAETWRDTTSSANWRSPSTTARSTAATLRSIRWSRWSGEVCYRASQERTCRGRASGFWSSSLLRMLCGTALESVAKWGCLKSIPSDLTLQTQSNLDYDNTYSYRNFLI